VTVADLETRVLERVGDNPATGGFYTAAEALAWVNAAQRIMVLLTLCLENNTATLPLAANQAYYRMMQQYPDWLLPLRVRIAGGVKLRPSRLSDLAALDGYWPASGGVPSRYAHVGFDLLCVYQQPLDAETSLAITYARCPVQLVNPGDVPEVPYEYHPALIDAAIVLSRCKEGGGEWKKNLPLWDRFMDGCQKLGAYVKARNVEQGYDRLPVEIARYDRSKLLQKVAS
jgi:hypothetical protein